MPQCRVCLAVNVRMHFISNTRYQEFYEKLSGTKLSTEDGMPNTVCFVCNSQLQKFGKFIDMSEEAERFLKKRLLAGIEMSQATQNKMKLLYNLTISSIQTMCYIDNGEVVEPEVTVIIKEEPVDFEEEMYKEEYLDSPTDEMFPEVETIIETTPSLKPEDIPTQSNKPWPEFPNMEFGKNEVCIKTESLEPEDTSDITQSLLHNLSLALEAMPLNQTDTYPPKNEPKSNYFCTLCHYKTHTVKALKRHTKVHNLSFTYCCEFCLYRFANDKKLAKHRDYCTVCSICGKKFSNINGLRIHVRLHTGIQPYYCDSCGRGFNQKTNLQTHMRVHSRDKQYNCKICNKKFPFQSFLERHMLMHGTDSLDMESLNKIINCHKLYVRKRKNTTCVCTVCGRLLQSNAGLTMHMRLHTGDRPFSCESCHRVFTQKANLLTHIERVHSGDKLFSCNVCHKMFPFNSDMKKHILSHAEPLSARHFEMFQQKHIYLIHKRFHKGQITPYACDMCQTRIFSY